MAARPVVSVYGLNGTKLDATVPLPSVFTAPIRPDLVQFVHKNMAKNHRQPYAVKQQAGEETSAESWGTGRAVARIPRVNGSGTHRAGQAAFGNMTRGGRMFAPNKVWRKWHIRTNTNQKRYATASAVAATGVSALVSGRGHRITKISEVPLVVSAEVESISKTKDAVGALKALKAYADVAKVSNTRSIRAGRGKMRNRRHRQRRGPLVVYAQDNGITRAFRNLPGVELVDVTRLNLLQLAPGGHLGRFVIWTQPAFEALNKVFGTQTEASEQKKGYTLPSAVISNPDVSRLIASDEIQAVVKPAGSRFTKRPFTQKKNPLRNTQVLVRLNPYAQVLRRAELLGKNKRTTKKVHKKSASDKFLEILKAD
ncbi:60S ribosomal protein L4B [Coemansia sp. RSA 1813]|nr:60S ribosomal protein L4B [Coemansia sp. RSA 1646]KAJ1766539.1 60S ribosomal protein L4B [Coemansia sp. RSA 1843]KAJ2092249.1 60S ribosomal protein L4B [Coemansia sp. RSA 986]KAJ2211296.1 60S ribosomal protein L4B [Coemansia sp. RSA 487]KAJ2563191.1 60S ribosomal protein L4B [Coemansia sp. RSA 1813]